MLRHGIGVVRLVELLDGLIDGLLVRLLGDGFGRDQVLGTRDLVMESADDMGPDVGSFSVR